MSEKLKNAFPPNAIEALAGRIPECLDRVNLGGHVVRDLLKMLRTETSFNALEVRKRGWVGIQAETDGQMTDADEALLVSMLRDYGIETLFATSKYELDRSNGETVLVAKVPYPVASDICALRSGFWCTGDWIGLLEKRNLLWHSWREALYFSVPLRFALVQLIEGSGRTTIVGSEDFITAFKHRSEASDYHWETWGASPGTPKDRSVQKPPDDQC